MAVSANVFDYPSSSKAISQKLPPLKSIACKFTQEKIVPNSNVVLKSGGDFEFIKNKGVIFRTTYPINAISSYKASQNKRVNSILVAISNKNYSGINEEFDLFYEKNNNFWVLGLRPKKASALANQLSSITIKGDININCIVINTKDSGSTKILFDSN